MTRLQRNMVWTLNHVHVIVCLLLMGAILLPKSSSSSSSSSVTAFTTTATTTRSNRRSSRPFLLSRISPTNSQKQQSSPSFPPQQVQRTQSPLCLSAYGNPLFHRGADDNDDNDDDDSSDEQEAQQQQQQPRESQETADQRAKRAAAQAETTLLSSTSAGGPPCVIKVLGVGGGGGNAVNRMIQTRIEGVSFWAINTDAQALAKSLAPNVLNIGRALTRGLGAGGDPLVGASAARENAQEIDRICDGADMIFITAGMGGGTGSGAAPVVADIAKNDCGCLTVGVVTKPFAFEGRKRMKQAEKAIEELRRHVDTLIVVSNDKLLRIVPDNTPVTDAFLVADDILRQGVVGISEIILKTGLVNVDFADVRAVMKDAGTALMGVGTGVGKSRASDAAVAAISSPLLDFPIQRAKRIVFNIVGGNDMGLQEINQASEVIYENADDNANIIFGALVDPTMEEEISITVLACDFDSKIPVDMLEGGDAAAAAMSTSSRGVDGGGDTDESNTSSDFRDPNFYKDRRRNTSSPLGPDASLEETRVAITRGFKKPHKSSSRSSSQTPENEEKKKKGLRGFLKRKFLRRGEE